MPSETRTVFAPSGAERVSDQVETAPGPNQRPNLWLTRGLLLVTDAVALILSVLAAAAIWHAFQPLAGLDTAVPLLFAVPVLLAGFMFMSLYPAAGLSVVQELRRTTLFTSAIMGTAVVVLFLLGRAGSASRGAWLLTWLFMVCSVPLARALVRHLLASRAWWGVPTVILGAGKTAELLVARTKQLPGIGFKVIACFDDDPAKRGSAIHGVPVVGTLADAADMQAKWHAAYAMVAMPGIEPRRLSQLMQNYARVYPHVLVVPNMFGLSSAGVGARDVGGIVTIYNKQNLLMRHNRIAKRLIDFILLVPGGIVGALLVGIGALVVVLVDRGNPFYFQLREGRGGKVIRVWKIRTMRKDADAFLECHLAAHPEAREEWEKHFKLTDDPRVLPVVGNLLRRTSLDELPQLWNIFLGQMSFVGPRPFPYYHLDGFDPEFRDLRTSVTPGLTGYWQVTSRSTADLDMQESLDTYYIRNWSIWLDIYILARTPAAVLFGKGAY